ncbi:MAG: ribosome-associated translation inhibitor RaiA [Gammaproteobacteria bacterium]|nr:ribosome-associated translation inhibitor RaiA [Gammaproteobacteria bacterium]MDH3858701.1 ribosome-associated translation inhibitor RaiA [Gammaproteobacteria bacterium]
MQVSLSGHHVDITESMRNYVNEKVGKLDRHFDQALDIHIVLTVEKLRHKAEATLHVSGSNLHADDVQEDMYAAIDGLVDKLDRQGKKHKEKLKSHRLKGTSAELA